MKRVRSIRTLAASVALLGGTALAGSFALPVPASAGVSVGIGVGVPGPAFYGTYRIRTGPCSHPRFAFNHPGRCGYPRFSEPVFIDGAWVNEPLYYRTYGGHRYFWRDGRWIVGHGSWDGHMLRSDWRRTWHDRGGDRDHWRGGDRDRDHNGWRGRDNDRDDMRGDDHDNDHDNDRGH